MFCAVKNCRTTSANGSVFSLPEDIKVRQSWLDACRLQSSEISPNHGLCHIHFKADEIKRDPSSGTARPSFGSVPSLFLEAGTSHHFANDRRLSVFECKRNEVNVENTIQDQVTSLLDTNIRYQQKICPLLKKISDLEKAKLRRYTDVTKQKSVMDQLFRLNQIPLLQLKKVNKTVDFDEKGFLVGKNEPATKNHVSKLGNKNHVSERIENALNSIETLKFAKTSLTTK